MTKSQRKGWYNHRQQHVLASKGIKTSSGINNFNHKNPYFILDKHDIPNVVEFMTNRDYWNKKRDMDYKIIWMPVEEYEKAIEYGFNKDNIYSGKEKFDYPIRERISEENLEKIKDLLKTNKVAMPYISYWVHNKFEEPTYRKIHFGQEGHHRAVASAELGETTIPVFVMYPINKWEEYGKGYMTLYMRGELYE